MALIKFVQDTNEGEDGQALIGDLADPVEVSQSASDTTPIGSWEISLVDLPFECELELGVIAQGNGATPAASFQPDVTGSYRVQLRTWPQANRQGRADTDIRIFGVKEANGFLVPPSQIWPEPLPDPLTGRPGAKPNEANFEGQLFGWAGNGEDGLLRNLIRMFGAGGSTGDFGAGTDGPLVASSGTTTLTRDTYYSTIDISGTAVIDTAGYRLYASEYCKITGTAYIHNNGAAGGNASGTTGGNFGAGPAVGSTLRAPDNNQGRGAAGPNGPAGSNQAGTQGVTTATVDHGWCARGGPGGGRGGQAIAIDGVDTITQAGAVTNQYRFDQVLPLLFQLLTIRSGENSPSKIWAGSGGCAGKFGATNSAEGNTAGGAGGGGGAAGALVCGFAELITDETTTAPIFRVIGGKGGNGGNATSATTEATGGGGGGGGGAGGAAAIAVGKRTGDVLVGAVAISGGGGGNGGNGTGTTGGSKASGGASGGGGASGQALAMNLATGVAASSIWANAPVTCNEVTPTDPPNLTGATVAPATQTRLDL